MMARCGALAAALALAACPAPRPTVRPPPVSLAPAEQHDEPALAGIVHVVKRGETLYRIARAYGIDPADLMETNGIVDPRNVAVGTELFVPGAAQEVEVPPAEGSVSHPPVPVPGPPSTPATADTAAPTAVHPERSADAEASERSRRATAVHPERSDSAHPERSRGEAPAESKGAEASARSRRAPTPTAIPTAAGSTPLAWPLKGVLYGRFGVRAGRRHDGIDIAAPEGTSVGAAAAGTVIYAGEQAGYGSIVIVRHDGGLVTLYAHASRLLVEEGAHVRRGEPIAKVGQTGRTTGPHLHFEVRDGTRPKNPLLFLP